MLRFIRENIGLGERMRKLLVISTVLLLVVPCFAQTASAQSESLSRQEDTAAAVQAAHEAFNTALVKVDLAALDKMVADTYVFTDPNGRVTAR